MPKIRTPGQDQDVDEEQDKGDYSVQEMDNQAVERNQTEAEDQVQKRQEPEPDPAEAFNDSLFEDVPDGRDLTGGTIHSLNDPDTESIKVDDGSRYVGVRDAQGKSTTVLCPKCGTPAHGKADTCPNPDCGASLDNDPSWDLVRCDECGKTFPETRDNCPSCGTSQAELLDHVGCANCNEVFVKSRGACPACGHEKAYEIP